MLEASTHHPESTLAEVMAALADECQAQAQERQAHAQTRTELLDLKQRFAQLEVRLQSLLRQRFGARTEHADQLQLFATPDVEVIEQTVVPSAPPAHKPKAPVRRERVVLPKGLPEERSRIDLPESEKFAADGTPLVCIGVEETVKLKIEPARMIKQVIERPKYADPRAPEAKIKIMPLPAQLLDGSLLSASLGAHMLVSKYADHLPLFRIEEIYARSGIKIPRNTLCDWVQRLTWWLKPLWNRLVFHLRAQAIVHVDETVLPLQAKGKTLSARAWAYVSRDPSIVVYAFTEDKKGEHVRAFLKGWQGYLQADAASNYDALFLSQPGIQEVGCWAHARRKFFDIAVAAEKAAPPGQAYRVLAHEAIEQIAALFAIERDASAAGDSPEQRQARRKAQAAPVLKAFRTWCEEKLIALLPKSPTAGAIAYVLKRWPVFERYLEDGRVAIDNNAAERALREIAVGRKNWLFAGSDRGGEACAVITSLIETAKAHGHNPLAYLTEVLTRLPTTKQKDIDTLLPMFWNTNSSSPNTKPNA